ncbi:hypothetical protein B0T24DRAFT_671771 [Lasiosphaeria ovina]|uniref:Myb/SANT-like domain-containing protein n=1 Tax=Lasiosphaeria ovina TaxID=92902 RepID=A0AAE0JSB0_9PEZI|nr:hypothetical protein B0T24DRAFT_671771 [Lasiosphaeria ovina]
MSHPSAAHMANTQPIDDHAVSMPPPAPHSTDPIGDNVIVIDGDDDDDDDDDVAMWFPPHPGPDVLPAPGVRQDGLPEVEPWKAVALPAPAPAPGVWHVEPWWLEVAPPAGVRHDGLPAIEPWVVDDIKSEPPSSQGELEPVSVAWLVEIKLEPASSEDELELELEPAAALPELEPAPAVAPLAPASSSPHVDDHAASPPRQRRRNKIWTDQVKSIVFATMCRCIDDGLRKDKFREESYNIAVDEVARIANVEMHMTDIENLMQHQRRKYRWWLELGTMHGGLWDESLKQWILEPAEWDKLVAEKREMKQFRGCTLKWLEESKKLWDADKVLKRQR